MNSCKVTIFCKIIVNNDIEGVQQISRFYYVKRLNKIIIVTLINFALNFFFFVIIVVIIIIIRFLGIFYVVFLCINTGMVIVPDKCFGTNGCG